MSDFPPPPPPGGPTPPPPPGGYGYGVPQYGQYGPQEHPKAGTIFTLGIVSLVLGVIGVFCCPLLGLLGTAPLVMSGSVTREIDSSGGQLTGAEKVRNGRLMGIIALCLTVLAIILNIVLVSTGVLDLDSFTTAS